MIPRAATSTLRRRARGFPVLALTGPRQSGKTTLARAEFADKPYASLENPDQRQFAESDPKGFLARFQDGAVIDEEQRGEPGGQVLPFASPRTLSAAKQTDGNRQRRHIVRSERVR